MNAPETKPIRHRETTMNERRTELMARLGKIETELTSHQETDWEEAATEREGDEVLQAEGLSAQQEVRQIDAALARITAGSYGTCVSCGARIAEARLDTLPFAPLCQNCAAKERKSS